MEPAVAVVKDHLSEFLCHGNHNGQHGEDCPWYARPGYTGSHSPAATRCNFHRRRTSSTSSDCTSHHWSCTRKKKRQQVQGNGPDKPTRTMLNDFPVIFANLRCLYLDAVHVSMRFETTFPGHHTPGSATLMKIMSTFTAKPDVQACYSLFTSQVLRRNRTMRRSLIAAAVSYRRVGRQASAGRKPRTPFERWTSTRLTSAGMSLCGPSPALRPSFRAELHRPCKKGAVPGGSLPPHCASHELRSVVQQPCSSKPLCRRSSSRWCRLALLREQLYIRTSSSRASRPSGITGPLFVATKLLRKLAFTSQTS